MACDRPMVVKKPKGKKSPWEGLVFFRSKKPVPYQASLPGLEKVPFLNFAKA